MTREAATHFAARASVTFAGGPAAEAELFARDGKLHVDGARIGFFYAYALDRLAADDEPNTVRVVGADLATVIDVTCPTTRDAERLLATLRVDSLAGPVTVVTGLAHVPWWLLGGPPFAILVGGLLYALTVGPPLLGWAAIGGAALVVVLLLRRKRRIVIDQEGLDVIDPARRLRVPQAWIAGVERVGDRGLRIALYGEARHGDRPAFADPERMRAGYEDVRERDPVDFQDMAPGARETLYFMLLRRRAIAKRLAAAAEGAPSSAAAASAPSSSSGDMGEEDARDLAGALAFGGRDGRVWLDSLSAFVPRDGYRTRAPSDAELAELVRDLDADPAARLGAFIVLRRRDETPPALHLSEETRAATKAAVAAVIGALEHDDEPSREVDALVRAVR